MENKTEAWRKYYNNDKKFLAKLKIAMAVNIYVTIIRLVMILNQKKNYLKVLKC